MALSIGNKTFMNLQEAVGWLLENNALPFQSTANYVGNTEIAMSTLINPSPAKVRVGSLIFFADSKVSTVIGVTSNSFIVSDQYNDLVDDVVYVTNVEINASGHLICTLSNGDTIDAGLIKQVSNFSINASQHLIANYNDSTSTDLGAIFSGNINISGNITASGTISAPTISGTNVTGDSIIENMSGYSWTTAADTTDEHHELTYVGCVKNGNKLTIRIFGTIKPYYTTFGGRRQLGTLTIPSALADLIYPYTIDGVSVVDLTQRQCFSTLDVAKAFNFSIQKSTYGRFYVYIKTGEAVTVNDVYVFSYEVTFLLSNNLAS